MTLKWGWGTKAGSNLALEKMEQGPGALTRGRGRGRDELNFGGSMTAYL